MREIFDVIVVGDGPAEYVAAIKFYAVGIENCKY